MNEEGSRVHAAAGHTPGVLPDRGGGRQGRGGRKSDGEFGASGVTTKQGLGRVASGPRPGSAPAVGAPAEG